MTNSQKMLSALEDYDLEKADAYFEKALAQDDEDILIDLAFYLEQLGFFPQAKTIYLRFYEKHPELNLHLAQIAHEDGDAEQAFLYLENISKDSPDYLNSLLQMADFYDSEGLADVAREKLLEALSLSDEPLIRLGLAEIDLSLGNFKEAIDYYASLDNRAILAETGISTYERIGKAYFNLGQFETAISFLEKSVEISYDDQTVFELAGLLCEQGQYQKANLYFKQLTTINPDFDGYHYLYATALRSENQLEEAYRVVQEGLAKNSFDSALLLLASQLAYERHDSEKAEQYLLEARDIAADDDEILLRLSSLYLEQERFEDLAALDNADIDNLLTKWQIARGYEGLGEEEEALTIYQTLADDLQANPEFLKDYAYLLRSFGYDKEAIIRARQYLAIVPDDLTMLDFLEDLDQSFD